MAKKEMNEDLFDDANEVKVNFFKLDEVGAKCKGVYVEKKVIPNRLKMKANPNAKQTVYTLVQDDGTLIFVAGRQGNPAILTGMEQRKFGDYVGVKYIGESDTAKPGENKTKFVKVYFNNVTKPEVLEAYMTGGSSQDADPDLNA